jgi:hypothetical protein
MLHFEPSLALGFRNGILLYFWLLLNNGAGGGAVASRLTSTNPLTVLDAELRQERIRAYVNLPMLLILPRTS